MSELPEQQTVNQAVRISRVFRSRATRTRAAQRPGVLKQPAPAVRPAVKGHQVEHNPDQENIVHRLKFRRHLNQLRHQVLHLKVLRHQEMTAVETVAVVEADRLVNENN